MSDAPIRAFFAIELDDAARAAAAALLARLRRDGDGVRWVRPEALHVTLRFLGDVAPDRVAPLARSVGAQVAACPRFALRLGAVHPFPSPRRARVVAIEVTPEEPLAALAAAVERGVAEHGFEPEGRRFRAHLTLGRVKGGRAPATRGLAAPPDTTWDVDEVVLFRSELRREGARYTALERVALSNHP